MHSSGVLGPRRRDERRDILARWRTAQKRDHFSHGAERGRRSHGDVAHLPLNACVEHAWSQYISQGRGRLVFAATGGVGGIAEGTAPSAQQVGLLSSVARGTDMVV